MESRSITSLRELHGSRVAVSLPVPDAPIVLRGMASFAEGSLRIAVDDASGSFDILIKELEWDGEIHPLDNEDGFLIRLASPLANY